MIGSNSRLAPGGPGIEPVGIDFFDLNVSEQKAAIRFTFFLLDNNRWEGKDYTIHLQARADSRAGRSEYEQPSRAA